MEAGTATMRNLTARVTALERRTAPARSGVRVLVRPAGVDDDPAALAVWEARLAEHHDAELTVILRKDVAD
jgi:hypothetical protein